MAVILIGPACSTFRDLTALSHRVQHDYVQYVDDVVPSHRKAHVKF